jgi:uncharacterized protein (DUF1800 family)
VVDAQILHLLRRATYGPTPALITQATHLGRRAWLEHQLAPAGIADTATQAMIKKQFPALTWPISKVLSHYAASAGSWDVMEQLTRATVARAIWSERQLFESMVEFWSNHLNVTNPLGEVWASRAHYDHTVIRKHALGSFDDLLVAASLHPAMQYYLDNASSTKWHPNENQGRELLELHSLGAETLYAGADPESDVKNSARILTGLSVDDTTGGPVFLPARHYVGPVKVLDFEHPNSTDAGGRDVAVGYLRWLARHPATAESIARKLAIRFVRDDPPASLITALTATYLRNDTAIVPVLRQLFNSPEFAAAAGQKVRRPYEDLVATVRVLGLRPDAKGTVGLQGLHWMLVNMGQAPLGWSPPNGYPDVSPAWQSAAGTLSRWNAHLNIAARWWPKTLTGPALTTMVPKKLPATHGDLIDILSKRLLQRSIPAAQKSAICAFRTDQWSTVKPSTPQRRNSSAIGWRLPYVVALLLDSPLHALR